MRKLLAIIGTVFATLIPCFAGQSVTLAWNANLEPDLTGYRLYWGTASRTYTDHIVILAPATTGTIEHLLPCRTYFFAVTAYIDLGTSDGAYLESDYSDEVFYTVPGDCTPPPLAGPASIGLTWTEIPPTSGLNLQNVLLSWSPVSDAQGYTIHVGEASRDYVASFQVLSPATSYEWTGGLWRGRTYYFAVSAFRDTENSGFSPEFRFTVPMVPPPTVDLSPAGIRFVVDINYVDTVEMTRDLVDWKRIPTDLFTLQPDGSLFLPRDFFPAEDPHRFFRIRRMPH